MRINLDNVLSTFNKAAAKLEQFNQQCDNDIETYSWAIEKAQQGKADVQKEKTRAMNSLKKIKEIVG